MAYPWPGFSTFLFTRDESPLDGIGGAWRPKPSYQQSTILGAARDSIVTIAIGSDEREFEVYLSPDRYAVLRALMNTSGQFCDWNRPTPDARTAFLALVDPGKSAAVACSDGTTQRKIQTRVRLVSQ